MLPRLFKFTSISFSFWSSAFILSSLPSSPICLYRSFICPSILLFLSSSSLVSFSILSWSLASLSFFIAPDFPKTSLKAARADSLSSRKVAPVVVPSSPFSEIPSMASITGPYFEAAFAGPISSRFAWISSQPVALPVILSMHRAPYSSTAYPSLRDILEIPPAASFTAFLGIATAVFVTVGTCTSSSSFLERYSASSLGVFGAPAGFFFIKPLPAFLEASSSAARSTAILSPARAIASFIASPSVSMSFAASWYWARVKTSSIPVFLITLAATPPTMVRVKIVSIMAILYLSEASSTCCGVIFTPFPVARLMALWYCTQEGMLVRSATSFTSPIPIFTGMPNHSTLPFSSFLTAVSYMDFRTSVATTPTGVLTIAY
ncbi:Uncharacterised protein [uncultured archaeon]|nr:Uncharacterised protein [uncultured archaeon]